MLKTDQLMRFSKECTLLREVLESAPPIGEVDYRILWSNISLLLEALEKNKHPEDFHSMKNAPHHK